MILRTCILSILLFVNASDKVKYTVAKESKISLNLSTSVNKVNCRCQDEAEFLPNQTAEFRGNEEELKFFNTILKLDVNRINCRNKSINNDLRESLNASKFPQIEFELLSLTALHPSKVMPINVPKYFESKTYLTIAGKKLPQKIRVSVIRTDNDTYKLSADHKISMQAYNIVPKSPLKFIKIHDQASVTLDLVIKVRN